MAKCTCHMKLKGKSKCVKHGVILYNEAEVFSLSITNPNGRPMLPFDWLIHSGRVLARCHKIKFLSVFFLQLRNKFWKLKFVKKKIRGDFEGNILYLRQYCYSSDSYLKEIRKLNISCRCSLAAKIQSEFYECNQLSYGIQPGVFHLLSNVYYSGETSLCQFQVLLFLRTTCCSEYARNSLSNNSMLFNLHFVGTIITLINLNNFKYPTKIHLCSHPNQNDLLQDFVFFILSTLR